MRAVVGGGARRDRPRAGGAARRDRGAVLAAGDPPYGAAYDTMVTIHPSAVLRMRAPDRDVAFADLVRDLQVAARHLAP